MKLKPEIAALIASGYRRISRKHGLVARVDRPDWKTVMALQHVHGRVDRMADGMAWVEGLGASAPDHYRRLHSQDRLKLSNEDALCIPTSDWDTVGYVEKLK